MISAATYDASAQSWLAGPDAVFDVLAEELVAGVRGLVVDAGCGTGTATRRLLAEGARVVAVDSSPGMLRITRDSLGVPAVLGDVCRLPLADGCVDAAVLGFVLNHVESPWRALAEVRRVLRPGGRVRASTWARDDPRLVQAAVEEVLTAHGWRPPAWYGSFKVSSARESDTAELLTAAAHRAGLVGGSVVPQDVPLPLGAAALVSWRLGLPHTAPWFAALDRPARARVVEQAEAAVAAIPDPFVRILLLSASR